jgi:hypothetical protein
MVKGRKLFGLTFFLIFTAVFIAALKPGDREECMVVSRSEAAGVIGGKSSTISTISSAPPPLNISLSNVPYIYQDIPGNSRSAYYCGIASALMIRTKGRVGSSPYSYARSQIESWMKSVDTDLQNGYYSYNYKVNLVPNGLLYVKTNGSRSEQFEGTKTVVLDLFFNRYTYLPSPFYTSGLSIYVDNDYDAVDRIWNHIKNNNQPVVVITDLNELNYYNGRGSYPAWNANRSLHYQVVYGIYEQNGEKYFRVRDPLRNNEQFNVFSKYQYQDIIGMTNMAPVWVYGYGTIEARKTSPSYIMLVSGS